jgi:hypothetical protein
MSILLIVLLALGGLATLVAVVVFILKIGTVAHLWSKPDPQDESDGHTLAQSREAGRSPNTPD